MYKNARLKRSYIYSYIMVIFGLMIPVLLSFKTSMGLAIFYFILVVLTLASLIVSHVFYLKKPKVYFYTGASAILVYNILFLIGFITEIVYSSQGNPAPYAWIMLILTLPCCALLDTFFPLDIIKRYKNKDKENISL